MNDQLAHDRLQDILGLIDGWGSMYLRRWARCYPYLLEEPELDSVVNERIDEVRERTRLARDIIMAMGETSIAVQVDERPAYGQDHHPFTEARNAIVEALAIIRQREELAEIVGPVGPQLSTSELHPVIWGRAAKLWDDGHYSEAVRSAAFGLEGLLQAVAGLDVSGADLATLYSLNNPSQGSPRLRLHGIVEDPTSKTWKTAHEGAAASIRTAFLAVRNLVSHPGWPEPGPDEALEMIAVLSFAAHLVDRSEIRKAD